MRQKAEYSDKYGCNIQFNCGGEPISKISHGALDNKDIDGAQPKRFTSERYRPHPDQNTNTDGALTEGRSKFRAPSQPRNPLAPDYKLPPLPPPPEVEAQKFIRNTLDTSDIQGSKARIPKQLAKPDNALKTSDIEGSQPKGGPTQRNANIHPAAPIGFSKKPHNDMRMDVSDIAAKIKQPAPKKEQHNVIAEVEDGLGKSGNGAQRKKEYYESLRKHGTDVTRARDQAQTTLLAAVSINFQSAPSQNSAASALETQFTEIDKHKSGLLKPKEFETAIQRSGLDISKEKVAEVSKALGAASSSGMVAYQDLLTHLYDNIESSSSSSPADRTASADTTTSSTGEASSTTNTTAPPQWYVSRQRRIKTEVSMCMGQQPEATAASAAHVETPQEKATRQQRATGKKIQGLTRPGENKGNGANGGEVNSTKDSYWFADYQKAADTPAETKKPYHGGGGDGGGGKSELWFSKAGEDEKALKEMGVWRPTKDASIGIDFAKRKNNNTKGGAAAGGDGIAAAAGGQEQGLPPPKPAVFKPKHTVPTRKDRQMAEKDVERVRQLD